ncbi:hypothetical protein ABPG74_007938 [Tetrahymena malaccensis]
MQQGQITNFFKSSSKKKLDFKLKSGAEIKPNEEQEKIIYEDKKNHMQIKACAGSGKTTTILCRVKYLIEKENVNPNKILITAFNVDAAKNVKQKLNQLVSEKVEKLITVNNIDKLSKQWVTQSKQFDVDQLYVKEYTTKVVQLMKKDKAFRNKIVSQFDYIFFDEFQDVNPDEYEMLKIFASENTVITFIGDDAQNIYGFREAKLHNSAQAVDSDFPDIKKYYLTCNYRSTEYIVQFANSVLESAKSDYGYKMQMTSFPPNNQGNDQPPEFTKYISINEQNESIISHIQELVESGYTFDQIAVLSRTNKPLQFLEESLEIYNNQKGKNSVGKEDVIKIDGESQTSQNNNKGSLSKSQKSSLKKEQTFDGRIPYVAHISDNKEKNTKLKFKNSSSEQKVTLTTIHKSKGLEWDVVFLIGLNDDYFPGTNKEKEEEEERRIFYVAVTRAKKKLLMSFVWSKNNQNMTRFVAQIKSNLYTGYTQPLISEQQKCNEKMRTIDKIKSKTVILTEIIEFLTKDHYEQLRNQGFLDLKKEIIQIHFKCKLGQYIIDNNLVPEFAQFFKSYLIRSIGEEYTAMLTGKETSSVNSKSKGNKYDRGDDLENDEMAMAFNNKYCYGVLFSETSFSNLEHNSVNSLIYSIDQNLLSSYYIQDPKKRDEIFKSLIQFKDKTQKSDDILKSIFNVSMCHGIFNQRKRLLHKDDAFKHFEMNKNILKNSKKAFIPEVLKKTPKGGEVPQVNQTIYEESYQIKADYDIITEDTIFEIRFQQQQLIKPEDIIELQAKAQILQSAWKINKIKYIIIYYPLQGEMITMDIQNKQLEGVMKILYNARQDKQEACSVQSKSVPSSNQESQLNLSQSNIKLPLNNQVLKQISNDFFNKSESDESFHSQKNLQSKKKDPKSLFEKYGQEEDLYENNYGDEFYDNYDCLPITKAQYKELTSKMSMKLGSSSQNSQFSQENTFFKNAASSQNYNNRPKSLNDSDESQKTNNSSTNYANFGFVKASDIANIKSSLQTKKSITAQQKCIQKLSITANSSQTSQSQEKPVFNNPTTAFLREDQAKFTSVSSFHKPLVKKYSNTQNKN